MKCVIVNVGAAVGPMGVGDALSVVVALLELGTVLVEIASK